MFGFFKKNDEQEKARVERAEFELKALVDEIAALKGEVKQSQESIEQKTAAYEPKIQELESLRNELSQEIDKLKSEKEQLQERFDALEKDRSEIVENRQLLWEEYQKLDARNKEYDPEIKDKFHVLENEKNDLQERFSALEKDRSEIVENRQFLWEEYQKLDVSRNEWRDRFHQIETELAAIKENGISTLVSAGASFDGQNLDIESILQENRRHSIEVESLDQENNLLLLQIRQNQDEMERLSSENQTLKNLNHSLNAKWYRLERRFPNYIDYGGLEIISVDGVAAIPKIIWKVTDYSKANLALPEFYLQTTLHNGQAGIAILSKDGEVLNGQTLIPGLLQQSQEQREVFIEYSLSEWNKILAACDVLEQLIVNGGVGLGLAEGFDLSFWRGSLTSLVQSIKSLPNILRFDRVRLKRELVNPNYEHLWLEFYDVQLESYRQPKLELRLAAALVQAEGFSKFPKIEIPLVDGKDKPFESWYPESHDDQGAKLELRFALDKQVFDLGVFAKLSAQDQRLIQAFIYRLPAILNRLAKNKTSIHRQWQDWYEFAKATSFVMQNQLAQARALKPTGDSEGKEPDISPPAKAKKSISVVSMNKKGSESESVTKKSPPLKKVIQPKKKIVSKLAK